MKIDQDAKIKYISNKSISEKTDDVAVSPPSPYFPRNLARTFLTSGPA
jgi:hypothetical protein